ncbi:RagB/SusD family nutrient uptake outer membrane protein [Hymenobacter sp. BRD128]|uniref:RagB/SusD family nutrient uptake outer membrane protein n=1 Tax=Hymenobacter sp. BRD128 TaxID=2675878 RepID=UPI00156427B2|nr:RagB/SusD family nutrient uptake outer membrane protein [Hymenobacter sp. BRD128]QKG57598.1 RagB/SusD family nutrient uptake outer membrane protein [Hymenobacter sp. BRD128]
MKKIVLGLLAASLLTGSLAGCNSKLNVPPTSSIDAASALNTSTDVQAALIGCYTGLQSGSSYGGYIQLMSDLLGDNGDEAFVGTFNDPQQAQRKSLLITNVFVSSIWINDYDVINRTNNVLANLDKLDTSAKKASVEGEARFIRALVYFDLVRLYAKAWNDGTPSSNPGVPLVLTPTTTVTEASKVSRNTVAEVYAQIFTDLTKAEASLPLTNGFFANRAAAAGLLSRVYLQQGDFANAANAANRAINTAVTSNKAALNANYADNFVSASSTLGNSSEDIFAIQFSSQSGTNQLNVFYSVTRRADVNILPQFAARFEPGDTRQGLLLTNSTATYTRKYDVLYGNIKLMRLAELYLTRAEANFRAGTTVGATPLADINTIRTRAGLPLLTTLTLDAILKERRLELAFEGFRLGDLKRNQESAFDPLTNTTYAWNSPKLIFPIPLREINANPNLVQNAGY